MTESTSSRSRRDFLKASTATAASLSRLDTFPKHLDMEEPSLPSPGVTKLI
ncbi:MAG: twin-arginine translocation signal domain-containing protein [Isosphaeraceae bacterium]